MAFSVGTVSAKVTANIADFMQGMDKVHRRGAQVGNKLAGIGKTMAMGVTLPLAGVGAAMVKMASDAEETSSKFNTVFSSISRQAQDSANVLTRNFGLSSQASQQLLGDTGDLLTGFGFTQESALGLSEEVNKLAVDLASFTNFSGGAEGASQALTKALLGERESVKSLGISILEADVQAKILENTQKGLTFETERQAKAYATLQLAQEQSKNAIGDFARTQDSFANQSRQLKGEISDLAVEFGKKLLPAAKQIIGAVRNLVERFMNTSDAVKTMGLQIASMVAVAGPALVGLGVAIAALTSPIGLAVAAIAGLAAAVLYVWDNWKAITERISDIGWWRNAIIDMVQFFIKYSPISMMIDQFNRLLSYFNQAEISNPFSNFADKLELLKGETAEYETQFGSFMDAVNNGIASATGFDLNSMFNVSTGAEETGIAFRKIATESANMNREFARIPNEAIPYVRGLGQSTQGTSRWMGTLRGIADNFTSSFGQGMSNVIVQGERLVDVLKNIGKLLLSSAIQKGISILLSGGLGGGGFFGKGGGVLGAVFGGGSGKMSAAVNTASSMTTGSMNQVSMARAFESALDSKMSQLTPEAVWIMGEKGRLGV